MFCPGISVNWILTFSDKWFLGLGFYEGFSSLFHLALKSWKSEVFSNSIQEDVELLFGDSEGSNAWYLFMYLHARGFF